MKKLFGFFLALLASFILIGSASALEKPKVTDHEKINVYIFRGSGCSHCYDALNFLFGLNGEYDDYINVVTYEVWYNSNNSTLAKAVASKLGDEMGGVPYIVVGEKSFAGFGSSTGTEILETAFDYYQSKKYKDVVASVIKSGNYNEESQTLAEAAYAEGITEVVPPQIEEEDKDDTWIVLAVFVVIIGGFGALIYSSRKK